MKKFNKISAVVALLIGLAFTSCETTDLDLLDDPNNVTLDKADLNRYLNRIQLDFATFMRTMGDNGAELSRVEYMFGRTYINNYEPANQNFEWATAYQGMFSDMAGAEPLAIADENFKHIGIMKIIKGYTLITLVDYFGDIPFSQATQPVEFPAPIADPGADVYAGAIALIDEGIALLNEPGDALANDFFYDNDYTKWRKAGNSAKLIAYLNTGNSGAFNAIVSNSSNYISNASDDFQFQYGTNEANPDTRHPGYNTDYATSGAGSYRSNWLMGTMLELEDPRIRYYFYRQSSCTPGSDDCVFPGNEQEVLTCAGAPTPPHFPAGMIFCSLPDGYWGRDHGNAEGIPPDSFLRTINGVYPVGGRFDGDELASVAVGAGGGGAGIMPIMLSSYIDFMRAEFALNSNQVATARGFLESGLQKSISKVQSFGSVDPEANSTFFPTSGDNNAYISAVSSAFQNASGDARWNILAEQTFIDNYGNGSMSYNMYRRTGYPTNLQFNIEQAPGPFVRSMFYPANEANVNSNITQKPNVGVQVFWDNNPASPGFPVAN